MKKTLRNMTIQKIDIMVADAIKTVSYVNDKLTDQIECYFQINFYVIDDQEIFNNDDINHDYDDYYQIYIHLC